MIIEFELQGSRGLHKGVFETTGFSARFEEEFEIINSEKVIDGYKIFSHLSFSFFHHDKEKASRVYKALISILGTKISGNINITEIGFFKSHGK
jgi:hypothetical protein